MRKRDGSKSTFTVDTRFPAALIATANTCIAALANLEEWGMDMSKVKVVSVLGSKQGLERVARERPEVEVRSLLSYS